MRNPYTVESFSALQRAEIAEIVYRACETHTQWKVSVLFNEPKLLKSGFAWANNYEIQGFSALQRAEIAEIRRG